MKNHCKLCEVRSFTGNTSEIRYSLKCGYLKINIINNLSMTYKKILVFINNVGIGLFLYIIYK